MCSSDTNDDDTVVAVDCETKSEIVYSVPWPKSLALIRCCVTKRDWNESRRRRRHFTRDFSTDTLRKKKKKTRLLWRVCVDQSSIFASSHFQFKTSQKEFLAQKERKENRLLLLLCGF